MLMPINSSRNGGPFANSEAIFEKLFPKLKGSNQDLYAMALESFRAKVNSYIRRRPRLRRLRDLQRERRSRPGDTSERTA